MPGIQRYAAVNQMHAASELKTVLFCDQYGSLGGGQQILLELLKAAQACGFAAKAMLPGGPCADRLEALGAKVRRIPPCTLTQGKKGVSDIVRLATHNLSVFCKNISFFRSADLVYINGARMLPLAFLSQGILAKKAVCHIHLNHGNSEKTLFRYFLRQPLTAALIAPSSFIRRELINFNAVFDSNKFLVVENGLDERFAGICCEDRFAGKELRHIGIVGRVSPEKGQDVLPNLAARFPDMTFHVLGDAAFSAKDYEESLKQASPANVCFHGWVDDLPKTIREIGLQVCLVPSRCPPETPDRSFEAAPLVPLQMAALSCLVVVRSLGALQDVAEKLDLISFGRDEELAPIIEGLRKKAPQDLFAACKKTHETVVEHYSNKSFQERLRRSLQELVLP